MNDMLDQMHQISKMGGIKKIISSLPGGDKALRQAGDTMGEAQIKQIEAIIYSMTKQERLRPKIINGQRRRRIAEGSGRTVQEVNQLLRQWGEMNKMMSKMRQLTQGGAGAKRGLRQMKDMMRQMGVSSGGANPFGAPGMGGSLPNLGNFGGMGSAKNPFGNGKFPF